MTQQKAALSVGCCRGEWTGCVGSGLSQAAWCASSCCWWLCFLLLAKSCPLAAAVFSLDPPVRCCLLGSFGSPTALCPFPWDTKLPLAPWKGRVGAASCQHPPLMPFSGLLKPALVDLCLYNPGKQTPCRVFLSFCLFQDEILGIICRIAFMTVLTVLSGHFKPPRFR